MAHLEIAETINQLIAKLIALDNTESGFDIFAELISNNINEKIAELIILATRSDKSFDRTVKETIHDKDSVAEAAQEANLELAADLLGDVLKLFPEVRPANKIIALEKTGLAAEARLAQDAIKEHVAEIISLKKAGTDAVLTADADVGVLVDAISTTVAHFIENNKIEIEVQLIKRMTNAELVSFTRSELLFMILIA